MICPHCGKTVPCPWQRKNYVDFEDLAGQMGYENSYEMLWSLRNRKKMAIQAIADKLGVGYSTVYRRLRAARLR